MKTDIKPVALAFLEAINEAQKISIKKQKGEQLSKTEKMKYSQICKFFALK